ncbi:MULTISPECIES: helix-turn-helix domain-containing protein [Mycolicibacter]|uniref:helix-turn-helix domain-containing protein n=1 Tax=Mycolicibacter TaxID=1073531 RepID=UPI0038B544F2
MSTHTLSPAEAPIRLGISRAGVQRRIASGEIAADRIGVRYRIRSSEVDRVSRLLQGRAAEDGGGAAIAHRPDRPYAAVYRQVLFPVLDGTCCPFFDEAAITPPRPPTAKR